MRTFKHLFLVFIISFGFFTTAQPQEPVFASACMSVGTSVYIDTEDWVHHYQVTIYDALAITNLSLEYENGQAVEEYHWTTVQPGEVLVDMWLDHQSLGISKTANMQVYDLGGVVGCSPSSSFSLFFGDAGQPDNPGEN